MSWIQDLMKPEMRGWEDFYRNRYVHDKIVRSTHGVNCTGGCSWMVFVKNGIVTWEMQAIDYPRFDPALPDYEPRGCQRGICFSWYIYSPVRVKHPGAKLVVLSPDFSQVSKYADWWIPINAGMDGAFWMAVCHVILKECYADRDVASFTDYLKRYSDAPFLVELERTGDTYVPGRFLRAGQIDRYEKTKNGGWKFLVLDKRSGEPRMPLGSIGFRWQEKKGQWNLEMKDAVDGSPIDPLLTFIDSGESYPVSFTDFGKSETFVRHVPVRPVKTEKGRLHVTTVFDLLMAQFGVSRGLGGAYPGDYGDEHAPHTPGWQEKYTGIGRDTVIRFAREWGSTAERTGGRCMVIPGSGANHWYHSNLNYRASITAFSCAAVWA